MGDMETLAKARRELEELYLGVPDDSVNLTFKDLSEVRPNKNASFSSSSSDKNIKQSTSQKETKMFDVPISKMEEPLPDKPLTKLPSLDFSRAFENTILENPHHANYNHHHHHHTVLQNHHRPQNHVHHVMDHSYDGLGRHHHAMDGHVGNHHAMHKHVQHGHGGNSHRASPYGSHQRMHVVGNSMAYDDMSQMSGISMTASTVGPYPGRRRPGIPHSNICTYCSNYIYVFRHRCLVCGRVYCRQCVGIGMGEMAEGRKCVECLGKRFSQRYIHRAGQMGCCMGYPSNVKQQELIWAEKGPRRVAENRQGRSSMVSTSRSPALPHSSFIMGSPYSPYSSAHHPLPL